MLESISPYELLKASRPKSPTFLADYDQRLNSGPFAQALSIPASSMPDRPAVPPPSRVTTAPAKRTHYIADIQNRHTAAQRRLPLHSNS